MVKRTASSNENEPDQASFDMPSPKEHLLQVVDLYDMNYEGNKFNLDPDTVIAKLEVVGGEEEGRTMLTRLSLDDKWKGFFSTRLFLKAIDEPYKGDQFAINTDNWIGRQFYATIVHNDYKGKKYANISEYDFEKKIEQSNVSRETFVGETKKSDEIAWDDDINK